MVTGKFFFCKFYTVRECVSKRRRREYKKWTLDPLLREEVPSSIICLYIVEFCIIGCMKPYTKCILYILNNSAMPMALCTWSSIYKVYTFLTNKKLLVRLFKPFNTRMEPTVCKWSTTKKNIH